MGAGDQPNDVYEAASDLAPKRKASVDAAWAALHSGGKGKSSAPVSKGKHALVVLAKLNRTTNAGVKKDNSGKPIGKPVDDNEWRMLLGGPNGGKTKTKQQMEDSLVAARSALEKATGVVRVSQKERTDGVVRVTETRNFAGKQMEVTKTYETGSREAKQAAKRDAAEKQGGLDAVLLQMEKQKKLNVLDKSKMDWKEVKQGDASMEEDLEKHKKGKTYLEEQDFLKRAELREYEIERDARLAGDVRSRGRL